MLSIYPAIFFEELNGTYTVIFPDLSHLATCGDTLTEAMAEAEDCLAGYLFDERLDGHKPPEPTPLDLIDPHCEDDTDWQYKKAFVNLVSVDVAAYAQQHFSKPVKKTLSIPKWLNDIAVERKVNFSKALQRALIKELNLTNTP